MQIFLLTSKATFYLAEIFKFLLLKIKLSPLLFLAQNAMKPSMNATLMQSKSLTFSFEVFSVVILIIKNYLQAQLTPLKLQIPFLYDLKKALF